MKTQLDNKITYNIGLFLINYLAIVIFNYDYLQRHIADKSPLAFLLIFGVIGLLLALGFTGLKFFIPIKILLIDIICAIASFFIVNMWLYPTPCQSVGCIFANGFENVWLDFGLLIMALFFTLQLHLIVPIIGVIYGILLWKKYKNNPIQNV